ncbi:MAG: hypothetical protein CVT80_16840 [Alphaproteobacteria bacterium HGW-Alphaproteobacteria-2]|nr:MAG: hypothetical protein CVT80_16840 [Alphaproteobacteria bacterium HGW-Alphaproteobacteria-2]
MAETARTVIIEAHGGPEVLQLADRPLGEPGPGQIRIRHHACGLNFIDIYQRSGLYKLAGGVGLIACQWAASEGITLIATAGTDEKCALAKAHGATHTINYRSEDFVKRVRELTAGRGVDVVMDSVGRDTFDGSLDSLRPLGMMISFGSASGPVPPVDLVAQLSAKGSLKITRPTLFTHIADHSTCQQMARELFEKVLTGAVKIRIDQRFPLAEVAEAHRALEARATTGATVLLP